MRNIVTAAAVAAVFGLTAGTADAQLFRRSTKVTVNTGPQVVRGGQPARIVGRPVRLVQPVRIAAPAAPVQVEVRQGGLFRRAEVRINTAPTFVGQPAAIQIQQIVARRDLAVRGQLDQLNTYTTAHNAPAAIRFVQASPVYVTQPPVVAAPIVVQHQYTLPAQIVQQVQPVQVREVVTPVADTQAACPCNTAGTQAAPVAAPAPTDPSVQYLTQQPARVVQNVVTVERPVAVTQHQVYMTAAPIRSRAFSHACN